LSDDTERFVAVVFTHKDRGTALRAFAELQRRYPKLMEHRQSELQLVDTSKNGIWYRLVVLPAGSHEEASETCGRLGAGGYDRCWVKAY
jgi:SPOR domain